MFATAAVLGIRLTGNVVASLIDRLTPGTGRLISNVALTVELLVEPGELSVGLVRELEVVFIGALCRALVDITDEEVNGREL